MVLCVAAGLFTPQLLPLRLRAGAPCTLTLLEGHPWEAQACPAPGLLLSLCADML